MHDGIYPGNGEAVSYGMPLSCFLVVMQKCHQYVLHPYNPDLTAHHKATCTGTAAQEVDGVADPAPAEVKPDAEVDPAAAQPEAEGSKGAVAKVAETVAAAAGADDAPPAAAAATATAVDESAPAPAAEEESEAAEVAEASQGLAKVTLED